MADWGQAIQANFPGRGEVVSGQTGAITATGINEVIAAQGAGSRLMIKTVLITSTSSAAITIDLNDDQTAVATFHLPAVYQYLPILFDPPLRLSPDVPFSVDISATPGTGSVRVTASGYVQR